jgi:maltose alpha-D-glucosyltransferase/alpha-amylase
MPFFPSPGRDDGYDIVDFYAVDPRLGTLGDLVELIRTANDRGIRVIADLVVNHTSVRHPWFQSARSSRDSPYRDFYVWRDEKPDEKPGDVVFPDQEQSNWTYDEQAGQWYLHRFYSEQPDLNVANSQVRDEIAQIAGFWLQLGLSGFRVDAVPFLVEPKGLPEGAVEDPHELLRDLRAYLGRRRGDAVLLGEVNLPPREQVTFFGSDGRRELDMIFNFHVMQAMYLALARRDAEPLRAAIERVGAPPDDCQWASFARNHDELTLDQLSESEREEVFAAFGPTEDVQLYGRGIRKRLPTMVAGDERRIRLVYSLTFALAGTPVLFYGEEIGMGENLDIDGRLAVRSPMQWSAGPNGGFSSTADPSALCRPVTSADGYGPDAVNVSAQQRGDGSLLNWFERLIRRRKECPELGFGRSTPLDAGDAAVLALRSSWQDGTIVTVHHLGAEPVTARLDLGDAEPSQRLVDLFGGEDLDLDDGAVELALEPYSCHWWRVEAAAD